MQEILYDINVPVTTGKRLNDPELYDLYYTSHDIINGSHNDYNYRENTMKANDLDIDSSQDKSSYHKKLQHLFSYFHPIGIWKKFRVPIEN